MICEICACQQEQYTPSHFFTALLQALNDLFAKISERDVPSRYLLRLGMGEAELVRALRICNRRMNGRQGGSALRQPFLPFGDHLRAPLCSLQETDLDFSRIGRVNAMLARRLELLAEVGRGPGC